MKAAFASSLAYRPSLIVLDEPFTGLDPLVRDELIEGLLERAPETTIFLSSHDLAEIESFASHVGYLEGGRMLFSDEMSVLADRFRDVTVTLAAPGPLPPNLPPAWLLPETADCVVHFIASEYQGDATAREIGAQVPFGARHLRRSDALAVDLSGYREIQPQPQPRAAYSGCRQEVGGMSQILNIFRKDTRRFWAEILLSVVLTFAFALAFPNEWKMFHDPRDRQRMMQIASALGVLMVVGWWLLIARVVHAETLVGDRQFWITRPYEWKKLLAAKVLFAIAWIGVPFLLSQSLMLAEAGYPPLGYAPVLLLSLLGISAVLFLPLFSVATVTANFARLALTLVACFALLIGIEFLGNGTFHGSYTAANPYTNWLPYPLLFCGCVLAIALQYATRRTWDSRALLIALPFLVALTVAANRRQSLVDRAYPQPSATSAAPVSIAAIPSAVHPFEARSYEGRDYIDFPVRFTGVADGYAVVTADFKFTITAADGSQWTSPWQEIHDHISPAGNSGWLSLELSPALYNRFKSGPVNLHITFAVSRYQAVSVATIPYPTHDQAVPGIGICGADAEYRYDNDTLLCRSAPRDPRLTYFTTLWTNAPCSVPPASPGATPQVDAWDESGNPGFAPLTAVRLSRVFFFKDEPAHAHLCPGSPLTVTQYHLVDRTQAGFTLANFVLPAYVQPT